MTVLEIYCITEENPMDIFFPLKLLEFWIAIQPETNIYPTLKQNLEKVSGKFWDDVGLGENYVFVASFSMETFLKPK